MILLMQHLNALSYTDKPDYQYIRELLIRISDKERDSETYLSPEASPKNSLFSGEIKRLVSLPARIAVQRWREILSEMRDSAGDDDEIYASLLEVAHHFNTFTDLECDRIEDFVSIQRNIYSIERQIHELKSKPPPAIQSFDQKRRAERDYRREAMRQRRIREERLRESLVTK